MTEHGWDVVFSMIVLTVGSIACYALASLLLHAVGLSEPHRTAVAVLLAVSAALSLQKLLKS